MEGLDSFLSGRLALPILSDSESKETARGLQHARGESVSILEQYGIVPSMPLFLLLANTKGMKSLRLWRKRVRVELTS